MRSCSVDAGIPVANITLSDRRMARGGYMALIHCVKSHTGLPIHSSRDELASNDHRCTTLNHDKMVA